MGVFITSHVKLITNTCHLVSVKGMSPCIRAIFRKVTKIRNLSRDHHMTMMLECNLELFSRVVLLANTGKSKGVSALALQSGLDRVRTILPQKLSWLHTQALIDRDREQTLTSKMIAHSRKAVDEDGRLCFCFFL